MSRKITKTFLIFAVCLIVTGCNSSENSCTDYSSSYNRAYYESDVKEKTADVFFICPTVYSGTDSSYNMTLDDSEAKAAFLGATNMEKGIYDDDCRFFAPYYRQAGLNAYRLDVKERERYLSLAYEDVRAAFLYYLENENNGRPIVLAGFSQGADMALRLLKDCFRDGQTRSLLVACYAIGWSITQEEIEQSPHLKFACGENDTGVIISFNSEAESADDSIMIEKGKKALAINPLNRKTDGTNADKSLNLGACFTNYSGEITSEIPHFTGAYIDSRRGALKVTDVSPESYPAGLDIFDEGVYHLYDYQFFYRNLEKNVGVRIKAFSNK